MKITITEAMGYSVEDTVLADVDNCRTLKDLVDNIERMDFYIGYKDDRDRLENFMIYQYGEYNSSEYKKFCDHKELPKLNLFTDHYDIDISDDLFERKCFIKIKKY